MNYHMKIKWNSIIKWNVVFITNYWNIRLGWGILGTVVDLHD